MTTIINSWIALPAAARLAILAVLGLGVGVALNWAIYTLAYDSRRISPWRAPEPHALPRRWSDKIPVWGWFGLRREAPLHGRFFWIRPVLMELGFAAATCGLYAFECIEGGVLPQEIRGVAVLPPYIYWMHILFFSHWVLLALMTVATFIDFDEQTVPDAITVPGTLGALLLASLSPAVFLPVLHQSGEFLSLEPVLLNEPSDWNGEWDGTRGLMLGLGLLTGWCFALTNRRLIFRRGLRKTVPYFVAGFLRHTYWPILLPIWILGSVFIVGVHAWGGGHWQGLLSSLAGMAVGGGAVWAVRLVAGSAMAQEAMGFGDVTLMGMIGAFIGWQASMIAFPLAPMTAIVIVLVQFILTRNRAVAFGPYLCAGTLVTIFGWPVLWRDFGSPAFALGPLLPLILLSLLGLMGVMLMTWRWIKETWIYRH